MDGGGTKGTEGQPRSQGLGVLHNRFPKDRAQSNTVGFKIGSG